MLSGGLGVGGHANKVGRQVGHALGPRPVHRELRIDEGFASSEGLGRNQKQGRCGIQSGQGGIQIMGIDVGDKVEADARRHMRV